MSKNEEVKAEAAPAEAKKNRRLLRWALIVVFGCALGLGAVELAKRHVVNVFELDVESGWFWSDTYVLTNQTGHELKDVGITMQVVYEDGVYEIKKNYATWAPGEQKALSTPCFDGKYYVKLRGVAGNGFLVSTSWALSTD